MCTIRFVHTYIGREKERQRRVLIRAPVLLPVLVSISTRTSSDTNSIDIRRLAYRKRSNKEKINKVSFVYMGAYFWSAW